MYIGSFRTFVLKHYLKENSPKGDIARDIKAGKCIPYFEKHYQTIDFLKQTGKWNDAAITTIEELLDEYEEDKNKIIREWREERNAWRKKL